MFNWFGKTKSTNSKKCLNDPHRTYKGDEPSPKGLGYCAHSEPKGKIMFGRDEKLWQVKDSGKWVKLKYYLSHFNGGRPFLVVLENNNSSAKIYQECKNGDSYDKLIGEYKPRKIHIGKDSNDKTVDGNTILLQLTENEFIYIGAWVYKFTLEKGDKFSKYFSMVGNNDVPYPILLGETNVYFLSQQKFIPKDKFVGNSANNFEDAYDYYYGHKGNVKMDKLYAKKIKKYKDIAYLM